MTLDHGNCALMRMLRTLLLPAGLIEANIALCLSCAALRCAAVRLERVNLVVKAYTAQRLNTVTTTINCFRIITEIGTC